MITTKLRSRQTKPRKKDSEGSSATPSTSSNSSSQSQEPIKKRSFEAWQHWYASQGYPGFYDYFGNYIYYDPNVTDPATVLSLSAPTNVTANDIAANNIAANNVAADSTANEVAVDSTANNYTADMYHHYASFPVDTSAEQQAQDYYNSGYQYDTTNQDYYYDPTQNYPQDDSQNQPLY